MSNGYLEKELIELPEKIDHKEREIINLKDQVSKEERSKKFLEIKIKREIFSEKMNDKQVFSNETVRTDELFLRMHRDEKALAVQSTLDEINDRLLIAHVEFNRLVNDFRGRRSIAIIKGGN